MAKSTRYIVAGANTGETALYARRAVIQTGVHDLNTRMSVDGTAFADAFYQMTSHVFRTAFLTRLKGIEAEKKADLGRYLTGAAHGRS